MPELTARSDLYGEGTANVDLDEDKLKEVRQRFIVADDLFVLVVVVVVAVMPYLLSCSYYCCRCCRHRRVFIAVVVAVVVVAVAFDIGVNAAAAFAVVVVAVSSTIKPSRAWTVSPSTLPYEPAPTPPISRPDRIRSLHQAVKKQKAFLSKGGEEVDDRKRKYNSMTSSEVRRLDKPSAILLCCPL